jgi:mevalonate kinase
MLRQISVSAPSKVILHGEHAVVYGRSAIAASLDLRTRMYLTPIAKENDILQVDFPDVSVTKCWSGKTISEEILNYKPDSSSDIDTDFLAKIQVFVAATIDSDSDQEASDTNQNNAKDLQIASLTCFFYLYAVICDKFIPMKIKVRGGN